MATFPSNRTRPALRRAREHGEPTLLPPEPGGETGRGSNVPEVTVSELSNALKRTVEDRFGFVRLRGEISNYRGPHASGHAYFCLKDEGARIDAVVWKTALARMRVKPEDGMEVVASGKITTFPGKSSYQIVVESLEPAGLGALMALLEERRRKLAAEGLFDAARKRPLPFLPRVIGVVTSPTGAVIRDILHRVGARFPRHVLVWPVRVQGETSAAEVAAAIRGFNALLDDISPHRPHLIIVARGGGSLEDLWGYNDEAVVRAVGESLIPLISAVGHETDWTLIDHAADLRAPTPTGAAEMALPVLADLFTSLVQLRGRQASAALRHLERVQAQLRAVSRLLPSGADLLAGPHQRLDRAGAQLPGTARQRIDRARLVLARLSHRLGAQSPQAQLARDGQRLLGLSDRLKRAGMLATDRKKQTSGTLSSRLRSAFAGRLRIARLGHGHDRERLDALAARFARTGRQGIDHRIRRLAAVGQMLAGLGYRSVLARGFALVRSGDGVALRTVEALRRTQSVTIEVSDGTAAAMITDVDPPRPSPPRRRGRADPNSPQASLFDL